MTESLLPLVQCPPLPDKHTLREQASPSAQQSYAACPRAWGYRYLEGRRETSLTWAEAKALPEPPKAPRGASALEKATAEAERKAWNKLRRPALGTEVHARLQAYMVQNVRRDVEGAWHPPLEWVELDWHDEPGRVSRPACDVLPDPASLVAVHTELAAECEAPEAWRWACMHCHQHGAAEDCPECQGTGEDPEARPWPRMPGFYDLITVEAQTAADGSRWLPGVHRLWDYKSTSSFDWAKTEEELREDPQVRLYALHAMQTFGLQEIECNWVYLLTDPEQRPKVYVVRVVITRAEAEQAAVEMATQAAAIVEKVRLFAAGKLRVVDLEQNVSACTAYGGCIYSVTRGGPCDPGRVSPGKALKQKAQLDEKVRARKDARRSAERDGRVMALSFEERRKQREAAKAAGGETAPAEEQVTMTAEAPPGEAPPAEEVIASVTGGMADALTKATEATAKLRENRPKATRASAVAVQAPEGAALVTIDGFSFAVPPGTALAKQLTKAANGLKAAAAAFEGE